MNFNGKGRLNPFGKMIVRKGLGRLKEQRVKRIDEREGFIALFLRHFDLSVMLNMR